MHPLAFGGSRWIFRRLVCLLALVLAMALLWFAGVPGALGQVDVVRPEDVTTPVPTPTGRPTPTPPPRERAGAGYVVQEGDTLLTAAIELGLDIDVMPCLLDPFYQLDTPLVIGEQLDPPAGELFCHHVQPGDTLSSIAARYEVDPSLILSDQWNRLSDINEIDAPLEAGRYVRILIESPDGFLNYLLERPIAEPPWVSYAVGGPTRTGNSEAVPKDWPYGSGYFEWPTYGWITQGYRNDHRALDIAAPLGTYVTAADRGVVVRAGWNNQGYGMFVVIDHNIDYVTLYSHLQDIFVHEGDIVAQGQVIGSVGSTGNSTGPHLHFEVRDFGARINPLEVLLR